MRFIGEVAVNGNPEMKGRARPSDVLTPPQIPKTDRLAPLVPGSRDKLIALGPDKFAQWMKDQPQVLLTDTSMRDVHQSLFATRMRNGRHAGDRAGVCVHPAESVLARMLGRSNLRRRAALPEGRSVRALGATAPADIRGHVLKQKISGGTRSDLGRKCRDTFSSLKKTCRKLGISFWSYLIDRISCSDQIPALHHIIEQRIAAA